MACFATTVSMQSGAPMMGTPEPAQMIYAAAQLARKYGLPVRAGGMLNGSKIADAQAAYELIATMIPTLMAGTNFVLHSAGWLEAGLAAGYGKFMLDADQIAMLQSFAEGHGPFAKRAARWRPSARSGLAATISAAPTPSATSRPRSIPRRSPTTTATSSGRPRARRTPTSAPPTAPARSLQQYEPPPLDPAIDEALLDFIAPQVGVAERGALAGARPQHHIASPR